MEEYIRVFEIKQELSDKDLNFLLTMDQENICFFRFVGGNLSETNGLVKQLYRLKDSKCLLFGIFRFPFRFEGKGRMQTAIEQYYRMKEACDAITYFYSDGMMEMLEEGTSIREANQQFEQFEKAPIEAIKEMVQQTGDINIDVRDIQTFIRDKKGALFIRTFEGISFDEPLKYLISAPYLPPDFTEGKQMIINVGYTNDVEMNTFRQINLRLNDLFNKAEIFKLGSYRIDEAGSRLKITLMVNGISDPFTRPNKMKQGPLYQYWFMRKWRKLSQKGRQAKWLSPMTQRREGEIGRNE
jgi:cell division protein FtsZ